MNDRSDRIRLGGPFRPGGLFSPQNPLRSGDEQQLTPNPVRFGGALRAGPHANAVRISASTVWLLFILFPLLDAIGTSRSPLPKGIIIAAATLFIVGYLALVFAWRYELAGAVPAALWVGLMAISTFLTTADTPNWGFLFTYCAACAAIISSDALVAPAVGLCVVMAAGVSALAGASGGTVLGAFATTAGVGLLMLLLRDLRIRNSELLEARAELARLAVAQERERFARDLHDLLGHSLSVIALKAELAGRLLESSRSDEAAGEISEVEKVARGALSEVREAVSGYRQPTLDRELEGALVALSAAGIEARVERAEVALDPRAEAVFAWAVREGATNVIRHSGARECVVRIVAGLDGASLEMLDDGSGAPNGNGGSGGHGLEGLAERVRELRGHLESGSRPEGGFRLAMTVPSGQA